MENNDLSTFFEKVNCIEPAFITLDYSEKECAVNFLETLLNKLKCLLKVNELAINKLKNIKNECTSVCVDGGRRKRKAARKGNSKIQKESTRSKPQTQTPCLQTPKQSEAKVKVEEDNTSRTRKRRSNPQKNLIPIATRKSLRTSHKKAVMDLGYDTPEQLEDFDELDSEWAQYESEAAENSTREKKLKISKSSRKKRNLPKPDINGDKLLLGKKKKSHANINNCVRKCKKCGECFTSLRSLKSHFLIHGVGYMSCRFCRKVMVNDASMLHHKCKRAKLMKTCKICGDDCTFKTFPELFDHMKNEHVALVEKPSSEMLFACSYCSRKFSRKVTLYMHLKVHAGNQFVCLKCGLFLEDKDSYGAHMTEHYADAKFRCQICKSSFHRQRLYYNHLDNHQKFDCRDCTRPFTCSRDLRKHMKMEHRDKYESEVKNFECEDCHRKFSQENQLEIHRRIHTGERPVQCSLCQLFFRTQKALQKHKQTYKHSLLSGDVIKERKYLCSQCGKAYFRKQALQRHLKQHTGEKNFNCGHCSYRCHEVNNLKRHVALHFQAERKFICEICGAAFHAKKTLEMHHRYKHNDERSYTCPDCPLSFKAQNALKRHIKVHERIKDHRCWCGASFNRLYNLRRHLRSVHNDDSSLPPVRKVEVLDSDTSFKVPYGEKSKPAPKMRANKLKKDASCSELLKPVQQETLVSLTASTMCTSLTTTPTQTPMIVPEQITPDELQQQQHMMVYDHMTAPAVVYQPPIADHTRLETFDNRVQTVAHDYYSNANMLMGVNMEHGQNDYNNSFMYIQNVLVPSMAMAGLLDLSQGHPGPGAGGKH